MDYSYLRAIRHGACSKWIQNSKWAKYLILIAVLCGIVAGVSITSVYSRLYDVSQPKTVMIDSISLIQSTRELTATVKTSFSRGCDKITYHMLESNVNGKINYYSLPPSIGGSNYSLSSNDYAVHITLPDTLPSGEYNYTIRSLYLCNFYGMTLFYPTETKPVHIHLN